MKGASILETLRQLGIAPSFSRPKVSKDNAYAESLFRTCKYRPDYPVQGFANIESARQPAGYPKSYEKKSVMGHHRSKRIEYSSRMAENCRQARTKNQIRGLAALTGFTLQSDNALVYKTLVTQEMLAKGYLAGNSVYVCIDHMPEVIEGFLDVLDPIFAKIKQCEEDRDVMSLLKGPVCHGGFKRLN